MYYHIYQKKEYKCAFHGLRTGMYHFGPQKVLVVYLEVQHLALLGTLG